MKYFIFIAAFIFLNCFLIAQQNLSIEISCDKPEIIQGEYIDILVKVINKTNKTITMGAPNHYLYDYTNGLIYTNHFGEGHVQIDIPANGSFYFLLDPQGYLMFKGKDFSTNTFPAGSYDYYLSLFIGEKEIKSNNIKINVKPVPDSLKSDFDKFKYIPGRYFTVEDYEKLYEEHKGTFYEKEFLDKLLCTYSYMEAIQNKEKAVVFREKATKLYKEFILKYPNTSQAYYLFSLIMNNFKANNNLVSNILSILKANDPKSKLLVVLRHEPEYMNKQIKQFLK
jgi:hypothetical protein